MRLGYYRDVGPFGNLKQALLGTFSWPTIFQLSFPFRCIGVRSFQKQMVVAFCWPAVSSLLSFACAWCFDGFVREIHCIEMVVSSSLCISSSYSLMAFTTFHPATVAILVRCCCSLLVVISSPIDTVSGMLR